MYPIDHLPLSHTDLGRLTSVFERLGFLVAPQAQFLSPDAPGEAWVTRGVFLERGWFDLQAAPMAATGRRAMPASCLFRVSDLNLAAQALSPLRLGPPFRLTRHWDEPRPAPVLAMAWANLRARVAPFMLAVIAYDAPDSDIDEAWRNHPNTALEILGLTFPDAGPGPAAEAAGRVLNLSGFCYGGSGMAVRVRVEDLERTAKCLEASQLPFSRSNSEITVAPFDILGCAIVFSN